MRGAFGRHFVSCCLLGIIGTSFAGISAGVEKASDVAIVARVYNYAQIPGPALGMAKKQAARILGRAGVATRWVDCATSPLESWGEPACATKPGPSELVLKLLPPKMAERLNRRSGTLGFAVPVSSKQWLGTAFVFVEEAERLAHYGTFPTRFDASYAVVLGHLIAHEIGHLLLGPDSHARSGIMSYPWTKRVLKRFGTAHLGFTSQEVERIQQQFNAANGSARLDMIARSKPH